MRRDAKYRKLVAVNAVVREQSLPETRIDNEEGREIYRNLSLIGADFAGIVDAILTSRNLTEEDKAILKHEVLRGSRLQHCVLQPDAAAPTEIDLSDLPDVLEYTRKLEDLRKACFEIVFGTRH